MDLILYKSSDLKPLSPLEVLGEFAKNRFGKYFPVAVPRLYLNLFALPEHLRMLMTLIMVIYS